MYNGNRQSRIISCGRFLLFVARRIANCFFLYPCLSQLRGRLNRIWCVQRIYKNMSATRENYTRAVNQNYFALITHKQSRYTLDQFNLIISLFMRGSGFSLLIVRLLLNHCTPITLFADRNQHRFAGAHTNNAFLSTEFSCRAANFIDDTIDSFALIIVFLVCFRLTKIVSETELKSLLSADTDGAMMSFVTCAHWRLSFYVSWRAGSTQTGVVAVASDR